MIGTFFKKILSPNKSSPTPTIDEAASAQLRHEEHKSKASELMAAERYEEAALYFGYATDALPTDSDSYTKRAFCYQSMGKSGEALALLESALKADPNNASAYFLKGLVYEGSGQTGSACDAYNNSIRINPGYEVAYVHLTRLEFFGGKIEDALRTAQQGVDKLPSSAPLYSYLGNIHKDLGNFDSALESYKKALAIAPQDYEVNYNLGVLLQENKQWDQALNYFDTSLQVQRNHDAIWNRGLSLLYLGRYQEGFTEYESRIEQSETQKFSYLKPIFQMLPKGRLWKGASIVDKTLLVWTEQGLGDSLMMMRYLSMVKSRFGVSKLIVYCEPTLMRTIACIPSVDQIVSKDHRDVGQYDFHCSLFSLPHYFETTLGSIPSTDRYVQVPSAIDRKWKQKFASYEGLKVGFSWTGNKQNQTNSKRSIAPQQLVPLIHTPGITAFNLQFPSIPEEFKEGKIRIADHMVECSDVMETLGLINNLDLVISVCTSVVHMAGAIGKEAWLMNKFESDWRWSTGVGTAPWYNSVTMFTQPEAGDWKSVIDLLGNSLNERARH